MRYFGLLLLAAHAAIAGDSHLPDFLPPGIKVMLGIQVGRIASSALAQGITPDASGMGLPGDWQKIASLAGFDSIKDIDEVLVASTGQSLEGKAAPMLLIARGNFNVERFGAKAVPYHGVPVLEGGAGSTGVVAMFDASTAVMGDLSEVRGAIDRRGAGAELDTTLAATVASLRGRYDIWGLGEKPSSLIPAGAKPGGMAAGGDSGFNSIDHFQFGISLSHGLELAAELHATSAKDVEKLTASVRFIELMMKSQPATADSPNFEVSATDGTIKLALAIPEQEFNKMVETQRAAMKQNPMRKMADTRIKISAPAQPAPVEAQAVRAPVVGAPALRAPANNDGISVFTLPGRRP